MGWNIDELDCPNCKRTAVQYMRPGESLEILCVHCGLYIKADHVFIVRMSTIDESLKGMNPDDIDIWKYVSYEEDKQDQEIVETGSEF